MITITGTNFLPSSLLSCRIGSSIMLSAVYVNSTAIQCMTPPSLLGAGSVEVSVSNNGEDYSDTFALFEYVNDTRVTSIHPISGSVSGGTVVTIRGYGFEDNTHYECQFGENHKVNTSFVSGNEMLCSSPFAMNSGVVDVVILSSSKILHGNSFKYKYIEERKEPKKAELLPYNEVRRTKIINQHCEGRDKEQIAVLDSNKLNGETDLSEVR